MKKILIFMFFFGLITSSILSVAQGQESDSQGERIRYRYKEYEKFDFEDLVIEGETGNPGDLSIAPRYQRKFKNKLPYRKNFNAEIRKGIERIR